MNLNFKILSMQDTKLAQMRPGAKIQLSRSYGLGCRRVKIYCPRRRRRVTDGKIFIAFFHVL
jgi:hypothetical protein